MSISVLITQCLQRDFVDPIRAHDALPNRLHVGHAEALRLMGPEPEAGPVSQLMCWARAQNPDALEVIHIRDWHDRDDPRQRDHLKMFGEHCIQNTPGARLVLDLDDKMGERERAINSIALNDFEDTDLSEQLEAIRKRAGSGGLRVGVVGVWTEAKVSFLLYDLKTRCGIHDLATCSALTASASRSQHFNALEQLNRILGVNVFSTTGEFVSWLMPGSQTRLPEKAKRFGHHVTLNMGKRTIGPAPALDDADSDIVGYLYRDSSQVLLDPLSGGFSGALVFRASSSDALGHQQAPSVVKLGPSKAIGAERVAFERVEGILGNNAPSVRGFVELGGRAGIKYSYASMGQGAIRSLKSMFDKNAPVEKIEAVLKCVFDDVFGSFYQASKYERLPLLEHYRFSSAFAGDVRKNVEKIVGAAAAQERLAFPGGYEAANLCGFYDTFLNEERPDHADYHYVSYVHGDLNGANVLIDGRENVWVIDFFHTARGHVLKDLAKLENDIQYIFTPIADDSVLEQALKITAALRAVLDLREPLPENVPGVTAAPLVRAWRVLRLLRGIAGGLCREDRDPSQMDIALLRYAAHTLAFDESSPMQKKWALAASCGFAEDISTAMRARRALYVDWLPPLPSSSAKTGENNAGRLGLTICPGRRDRQRSLSADLDSMKKDGVARLLCLVTDAELEWAGVPDLQAKAEARGIKVMRTSIPDQMTPTVADMRAMVAWIEDGVQRGERVVIHCMGGLGRSGTVAACVLVDRGLPAEDAITAVRKTRGPRAVENAMQEAFVDEYAMRPGNREGTERRG